MRAARVMAKVAGDKEGNGEGSKSNGNNDKDCKHVTGTNVMAMTIKGAMAMVPRWRATKSALARAARAMATAMRMAGNK